MKIVMFTNTYLPHVGGVARSVSTYEAEFCRRGHDVRIVAPQFEGAADFSGRVLRTPAIQNFNGSDFSFRIPVPGLLADFVDDFRPDLLHSHHPFLLGDAAMRLAWSRRLPLVFTYHTMYEEYTHYVPLALDAFKRFVIQMSTDYCNLCSHVIAPSESVARLLVERGVTTPVSAIPTGVDVDFLASGDRQRARERYHIRPDALVVGHVGRLAPEKNLDFLARAVQHYLDDRPNDVFLAVGAGEAADAMKSTLQAADESGQLIMPGCLTGQDLVDAYSAIDVFVFTSQSETQGMVLAEAMAAGATAIALDAPGVREIVNDKNGELLPRDASEADFAEALGTVTDNPALMKSRRTEAKRTARDFSIDHCADKLLAVYESLTRDPANVRTSNFEPWDRLLGRLEIEWNLLVEKTAAIAALAGQTAATKERLE
jgi:glycosyltransferase involved in cell wall biosynthesis